MQDWLASLRGRRYVTVLTQVWGGIFTTEFLVKLWLGATPPVDIMLAVSPWIMHGLMTAAIAFSIWSGKREGRLYGQAHPRQPQAA